MRSLSIAATGMLAQQLNVEVISNNIANMNTTAFKRQRAEFQDLLYQNARRVGAASSDQNTVVPAGVQIALAGRTVARWTVYRIVVPDGAGAALLAALPVDAILFTSGAQVEAFAAIASPGDARIVVQVSVAPVRAGSPPAPAADTKYTVDHGGWRVTVQSRLLAEDSRLEGLIAALPVSRLGEIDTRCPNPGCGD